MSLFGRLGNLARGFVRKAARFARPEPGIDRRTAREIERAEREAEEKAEKEAERRRAPDRGRVSRPEPATSDEPPPQEIPRSKKRM